MDVKLEVFCVITCVVIMMIPFCNAYNFGQGKDPCEAVRGLVFTQTKYKCRPNRVRRIRISRIRYSQFYEGDERECLGHKDDTDRYTRILRARERTRKVENAEAAKLAYSHQDIFYFLYILLLIFVQIRSMLTISSLSVFCVSRLRCLVGTGRRRKNPIEYNTKDESCEQTGLTCQNVAIPEKMSSNEDAEDEQFCTQFQTNVPAHVSLLPAVDETIN